MPWLCAQIGAREHYAVPRALHESGRLAVLYTDFWAGPLWRRLERSKLGALRSLATRYHAELENGKEHGKQTGQRLRHLTPPLSLIEAERGGQAEVISWNARALWWEVLRKVESRRRKADIETVRLLTPALSPIEEEREEQTESRTASTPHFGPYHGFIEVGRRFAIRVREDLKRRTDLSANTIFYAYDTGALEALEWCREHGVKCVLNQMDPNRVEVDLVRAEEKQWPGWALEAIEVPSAYFARREREWALADRVVVNSEFSRQALLQQGVPPEKLVVIPLCFEIKAENGKEKAETGLSRHLTPALSPSEAEREKEAESGKLETGNTNKEPDARQLFQLSAFPATPHPGSLPERGGEGIAGGFSVSSTINSQPSTDPLRVLFLGQVILRKGIQYLIAAAKLLKGENIHFDIVGPLGISAAAIATAPKNMRFHGRTSRDQAVSWYRQGHLFVLPTLSDGFAITQLEAMAHGMPVVTTPCCGEVVSDGVDGFVVPARDAGALAKVFQGYLTESELLRSQSAAALIKARQFTPERLTENLRQLEDSLWKS